MDTITYIDLKSQTLCQSLILYLLKCKNNIPLAQKKSIPFQGVTAEINFTQLNSMQAIFFLLSECYA